MRRKFLVLLPFGLIKLLAQTKLDPSQVPTQQTIVINFASGEIPIGVPNGILTTFTVAKPPIGNSLQLYRNGLCQLNLVNQTTGGGDYTLSGNTITFNSVSIPQMGDVLLAYYRY